MDPFSALSIATAVVQFLDFTSKLIVGTHKAYPGKNSAGGESLTIIIKSFESFLGDLEKSLRISKVLPASRSDEDILLLGQKCNETGKHILGTLKTIDKLSESKNVKNIFTRNPSRMVFSSLKAALLTLWKQPEIDQLCKDVESFKSQIELLMIGSLRYDRAATALHSLASCS